MINCFYLCVYWSIIHISEDMGKNLSVNKQIDKSIYCICWDTQPFQKKKRPLSMVCRWRRTKWPHTKNIILPGLTCKRKIKESENLGAESGMWEIRRCGGHRNKLQLCWMHHGDKLCCLGQSKTGQNAYTFFHDAQQAMGRWWEAASVRNHCTVESLSVTVST